MHTHPTSPPAPRTLGVLLAFVAAGLLASCGESPCDGPSCTALPDLGQPLDGGPADAPEADAPAHGDSDGGAGDGASTRAPLGAPCASSPECLTGLCFPTPQGDRFCTMRCFGPCPAGFVCEELGADRVCVVSTDCQPDCEGRPCGDDGCGGSCGTCPEGLECVAGTAGAPLCAVPKAPLGTPCAQGSACSSGLCAAVEARGPSVCAQPCSLLCPPGMRCDLTAPGAPEPGEGLCVPSDCQPDCQGKACGPDGCGGSCGGCPNGGVCDSGTCRELTCDDVPTVGCCVGEVRHVCVDGDLQEVDCSLGPHCGWNPVFASYQCHSDDESDPAGLLPRTCGVDPTGGGMGCAAWARCVAGCPEGDVWCLGACRDKTVSSARPLVDAVTACNAMGSCAWSEPCLQAQCPASWAECVATGSP